MTHLFFIEKEFVVMKLPRSRQICSKKRSSQSKKKLPR